MANPRGPRSRLAVAVALGSAVLAACGGGSSSTPARASPGTLNGVALGDGPVAGGTVTLTDSSSPVVSRSASTDASGAFSMDAGGLTPPFVLVVTGRDARGTRSLCAIAESGNEVDVTPITDIGCAHAAGDAGQAALAASPKRDAAVRARAVLTDLAASAAPLLNQYGIANLRTDQLAVRRLLADVAVRSASGIVTFANRRTGRPIQAVCLPGATFDPSQLPTDLFPGFDPGQLWSGHGPGFDPGQLPTNLVPGFDPGHAWTGLFPGFDPGQPWTGLVPGVDPDAFWTGLNPGFDPSQLWTGLVPGFDPGDCFDPGHLPTLFGPDGFFDPGQLPGFLPDGTFDPAVVISLFGPGTFDPAQLPTSLAPGHFDPGHVPSALGPGACFDPSQLPSLLGPGSGAAGPAASWIGGSAALYDSVCAGCHGALPTSAHRNATAVQILSRHANLVTSARAAALSAALSDWNLCDGSTWSGTPPADAGGTRSDLPSGHRPVPPGARCASCHP